MQTNIQTNEVKFYDAMKNALPAQTANGALSHSMADYTQTASGRIALFFKGCRGLEDQKLYEYLEKSCSENLSDTFLLAFHLRDPRGGKGERTLGRKALFFLSQKYPQEFLRIVSFLPEYGRWDDVLDFFSLEKARKLMANQLVIDEKNMREGNPISLCAKWTPTENDSRDRKNGNFRLLAETLGVTPKILRTNYNTPLREYLKIVEKFMCTKRWDLIDYNKVPSAAMKRLKKCFEKHSPEAFAKWRASLKTGETKVNAMTLFPHELIAEIRKNNGNLEVTEAQWKVIVEETKKLGVLNDALVVVDVSWSMHHPDFLPLDVSTALGLLISSLVEGEFANSVITFHHEPTFQTLSGTSLKERYSQLCDIPWGGNTNLRATFEMILNRAKLCNLSQEKMPKKLFIISDMQFDVACGGNTHTNFQVIDDLYKDAGYTRPNIVFWNVNGSSTDFPVTLTDEGTALISGFSQAILSSVLSGKNLTSYDVMRTTLDSDRYAPVKKALSETPFEVP